MSSHMYYREARRDSSNRRLNEHAWDIYPTLPGIELTTCSVPRGADPTWPQWRKIKCHIIIGFQNIFQSRFVRYGCMLKIRDGIYQIYQEQKWSEWWFCMQKNVHVWMKTETGWCGGGTGWCGGGKTGWCGRGTVWCGGERSGVVRNGVVW